MHEPTLKAWESFYVIVGSSGAALIGLQFVVMALIADLRQQNSSMATIDAFGTPTILHFGAALLIAAILSAPWPSIVGADVALGLCGFAGLVYAGLVIRRARGQSDYKMVLEDWIWHLTLPTLAYAALSTAALLLQRYTTLSLFVVGATALLLLFIGIHNAWDTVRYLVIERAEQRREESRE